MKGRKRQQPEHESPHEVRIVRAVEAAGVSDEERPFYLAFARELAMAQRHSWRSDNSEFRNQRPEFRTPGFTNEATKRCVQKWFERGLSGHKLWLIGEALMRTGLG